MLSGLRWTLTWWYQDAQPVCLFLSVLSLVRESTQLLPSRPPIADAARPSRHGQDSRFGQLPCSSYHQQTWGCPARPPDSTHHGICTSRHSFPGSWPSFLPLVPPFLDPSILPVTQPASEALFPLPTSSATSIPKLGIFDSFTWVILAFHGVLCIFNKRF